MPRSREQVVWDFVRGWFGKAESDLRAARHLLDLDHEDFFDVAFHAQQAAEKFLKALLVFHQIPFPKTHNIQELIDLAVPVDASIRAELAAAHVLTPFGVEFRYPGQEVADVATARRAVREAELVREAVLARLGPYLKRGRP